MKITVGTEDKERNSSTPAVNHRPSHNDEVIHFKQIFM